MFNKMKNIILLILKSLILAIIIIYAPSCTDYLEKPPSVDVTVDSVYGLANLFETKS